jgi:hypothetical protein
VSPFEQVSSTKSCLSRPPPRDTFQSPCPEAPPSITEDLPVDNQPWRPLPNTSNLLRPTLSTTSWILTPHPHTNTSKWKTYNPAHHHPPHPSTTPAPHPHRPRPRQSSSRASPPRRESPGDRNSQSPRPHCHRASVRKPTTRRSSAALSVSSATERLRTTQGNARGKRPRLWQSCLPAPITNSTHTAGYTVPYRQTSSSQKCNCALRGKLYRYCTLQS